jgi:Calcineurin-like phosphoesterase
MTSNIALATALCVVFVMSPGVGADGNGNGLFTFALIGDMPYGAEGDLKYPNVIADINADRRLAFVVHDGDIKNGSSLCSDAMYFDRLAQFNSFRHPLIYVPGDNEWTDCHRENNGSYDPLERLALLRSLFFSDEKSLGQRPIRLNRQSSNPAYATYRENVLWMMKGVVFSGLHIVGSNNNLGRTPSADAEYFARNAATLDWLRQTFALARYTRAKAVMLIIQANPGFELPAAQRTGFNDFLSALEEETIAYGRPVVLVHGDSHYFRIDKPMLGTTSRRRIEQFTRVETFGENDNHWLHVTVAPHNPNVFSFDQRLVVENFVQH